MNNTIFLIVGDSGSGKTTLVSELEKQFKLKAVQSYTTRVPRYDGEYGHIFISQEEFKKLKPDMVAYTFYNGYEYGVTSNQIDENDLYVIDPRGIDFFKEKYFGNKKYKTIYLKSSIETRIKRMEDRFIKDNNITTLNYLKMQSKILKNFDVITSRIKNDIIDFSGMLDKADFVIKNNLDDPIQSVVEKTINYIRSDINDTDKI